MYGIVGRKVGYCEETTASAYTIDYKVDRDRVDAKLSMAVQCPVYENDITLLRYPQENASIDDRNIDRLFVHRGDKWDKREEDHDYKFAK